MDQWYLQVSSWTRTAVCTVLFALCTLCPSALGWTLTGYSGHFEQQWNWRDSCVLSLTFCVCPRVMQLLLFCGHHPINTAADWWSLQQLSAAPWHILYTQIQMFTNTCSVCCLQCLEDFWVTATHFTWCFGHNNLNLQHDGMKSITSVSSLTKNFFDSWKIRSLSWKFHNFCLMKFVTRAGESSRSVESEKINCQQEGGTVNRSYSLLCLPHTTAESGSETMMLRIPDLSSLFSATAAAQT